MAQARKFNIEMTYLNVGREKVEKYTDDDDDDDDAVTEKEPSPEVLYMGGPEAPAPCPSSDGFYDERLASSGQDGYEVPEISRGHDYENPEEKRPPDSNVPRTSTARQGTSAGRRVNPDDYPRPSYELLNIPGTSDDRQENPAASLCQATTAPIETSAPLYEEIK